MNTEPISNEAAGPIVELLKGHSQKQAEFRKDLREDENEAAREVIRPRLDEARAIVAAVDAERRDSLEFIESVLTIPFDDLRRTVPVTVTVGSEIDTRTHVTLLERSARAAREALGNGNVVAIRRLISQIESTMEVDATRAVDLLGELWRVVEYAKTQPGAARTEVRNTRTNLARLQADIAGGAGYEQLPKQPGVKEPVLAPLPKPRVLATYADGRFDPWQDAPAEEAPAVPDIIAGPYLRVKTNGGRR
jgi:hypothetical protein